MEQTWLKADACNPYMGLDNKICTSSKYWCRLHQVWLSEADTMKHQCFCKPTYGLRSMRQCSCIETKKYNPFLKYKKDFE